MPRQLAVLACLLLTCASSQAGNWFEIPDSHMRAVCASTPIPPFPPHQLTCERVINAWSGAAFDPQGNRMLIFGGGHGHYYGNEVYQFDLDTDTWTRLTDPTTPPPGAEDHCVGTWDGGITPTSRHSYNHLAWVSHLDRMFMFGGVTSCENGGSLQDSWTFDPATGQWDRLREWSPVGDNFIQAIYDSATQRVFAKNNSGRDHSLYSFDFDSNAWTHLASNLDLDMLYRTGTLDSKRHQIWFVGEGTVNTLSLDPPYTLTAIATTGGEAIIRSSSPGVAYDPKRDRIVAWCGAPSHCNANARANRVYILNPVTRHWTIDVPVGDSPPPNTSSAGIFGRWRYSPIDDVFVAVNGVDSNVWLYQPGKGDRIFFNDFGL